MKILLTLGFTLIFGLTFAQPRVITFGDDEESDDTESGFENNNIKISLFELASGDFPIYYERALSEKFSAEVSAGVTFGDYFGSLFAKSEIAPSDYNVDAKYGFSLSAAVRFYPFAVFEDFYIAAEYKHRKYNWNRDIEVFTPSGSNAQKEVAESRVYAMPRINLGYSFFYDYNLTFDYHIGVGMNTPTETIYRIQPGDNQGALTEEKQNTRPRLHLGFKIGYVF